MKLTVFISSSDNVSDDFKKLASEFGKKMVENGCDLVYGGSDLGLMKILADSVETAGGNLYGITVSYVEGYLRPNLKEVQKTSSLGERHSRLLDSGDAVVVLPGGIGTLAETFDAVAKKEHGVFDKPIYILNFMGFYDGLQSQWEALFNNKFKEETKKDFLEFNNSMESFFKNLKTQDV